MSLDKLRKQIDEIDHKLISLLNERAKVVIEVGKLKSQTDGQIYAPDREKAVLDKITEDRRVDGPGDQRQRQDQQADQENHAYLQGRRDAEVGCR